MHKRGAFDFGWPCIGICRSLVETGKLVSGHFHDALATAAIENILTARNLLFLNIAYVLSVCLIIHLILSV